ncbi:hypothetical protein [Bradyrhizobium ganzhouense]|uniref:hypothetical protein n=1 Tax=Bradyrhizobium ganzhouense TaxID=1179767 RepID=UPI003CF705B6
MVATVFSVRLLDSEYRDIPSGSLVLAAMARMGFVYGSGKHAEQSLISIPHDVSSFEGLEYRGLPAELLGCACACLELYPVEGAAEIQVDAAAAEHPNARLGPQQADLLKCLESYGYSTAVLSAYRSPTFQALLFAARYLDGTLFDEKGRYLCLPPKFSDHCIVDAALDVEDGERLTLFLSTLAQKLPCSLFRPFLASDRIGFEPWHWRTLFLASDTVDESVCPENIPQPREVARTLAMGEYLDLDCGTPVKSESSKPSAHIFVHGYDVKKSGVCVGSRRRSIALSIADAIAAVGSWPYYVVTIPHGFTPLMDGNILESDIGACVFRSTSDASDIPTYITPYSCISDRVNVSGRVYKALEQKAGLAPGTPFYLEKSFVDEWLLLNQEAVVPVQYANPRSGFYRVADAPFLLPGRFDGWLGREHRGDVPPYIISHHERVPTYELDLVHFSLVLSYLREYDVGGGCADLATRLDAQLSRKLLPREIDQPLNLQELAAAVFYIRAKLFHDRSAAIEEFQRWSPLFRKASVDLRQDKAARLFLGHLASMMRELGPQVQGVGDLRQELIESSEVSQWVDEALFYSLAAAQIIAFNCSCGDRASHCLAGDLIAQIIGQPSSIGAAEDGAFERLESFQTALPVEAVGELLPYVPLTPEERQAVKLRLLKAVGFLFRCQFDEGVAMLPHGSTSLVGAMPYSLLDKHVRVDYGVHAARAARAVARLFANANP